MKITLRCDDDNHLGFVEGYSHYFYDERRVTALGLATVGGYFSEPYVFRGGKFIPAAQIEEEMGIEKYLKAKKPIYSLIGTGNVIVQAKISMSMQDNSYIPEKSSYTLYFLDKNSLVPKGVGEWSANLKRLTTMNDTLQSWLHKLGEAFVKNGNDRGLFLRSRFTQK